MFYGKSLKHEMTAYKNYRKYFQTVYLMRDLYSRICSELSQLSNKKTFPIKKKKRGGFEYAFSKEDVQMTYKNKKMLNIISHL